MTTPIERAAEEIDGYGIQFPRTLSRIAFESIDRDELFRVIDENWPFTPEHIADAILEWLTQ